MKRPGHLRVVSARQEEMSEPLEVGTKVDLSTDPKLPKIEATVVDESTSEEQSGCGRESEDDFATEQRVVLDAIDTYPY